MFDATKSYQYAFYAASALALGALAALLIARRTAAGDGMTAKSDMGPGGRLSATVEVGPIVYPQ